METITRKGGFVYLTTPNGWHGPKSERCVPLQHKSAWTVRDFLQRGYVVKGYMFRGLKGGGKIDKLYLLADYAWTPVARMIPQTGYGLEVFKKIT